MLFVIDLLNALYGYVYQNQAGTIQRGGGKAMWIDRYLKVVWYGNYPCYKTELESVQDVRISLWSVANEDLVNPRTYL